MSAPSVDAAKYFVTSLEEASEHLSACYMKTGGEKYGLQTRHVRWMGRQTNHRVNKIVFDDGKCISRELKT